MRQTRPELPQQPAQREHRAYPARQQTAPSTSGRHDPTLPERAADATAKIVEPHRDLDRIIAGWPHTWRAQYEKLSPAPSLWSYMELGADIMLSPDPARSEALKKVIGTLRLPRGTSSFLPPALPTSAGPEGADSLTPDEDFFQAGLQKVNPKLVILFGQDVLKISPYRNIPLKAFHERVAKGRLVLLLPSFTEVMSKPGTLDSTIIFLKSAFGKIKIF